MRFTLYFDLNNQLSDDRVHGGLIEAMQIASRLWSETKSIYKDFFSGDTSKLYV